MEDVLGDKFQPLAFNGSWLKNSQLLITDGNNNLQILDAPSGTIQPLLFNESIVSVKKDKPFIDPRFCADENYFSLCRRRHNDGRFGKKK